MDTHPTNDQVVPWTPRQVADHVAFLRDHLHTHPGTATAEDVLNVVTVMLDWTACPHTDCPRLLLEHDGGHTHDH